MLLCCYSCKHCWIWIVFILFMVYCSLWLCGAQVDLAVLIVNYCYTINQHLLVQTIALELSIIHLHQPIYIDFNCLVILSRIRGLLLKGSGCISLSYATFISVLPRSHSTRLSYQCHELDWGHIIRVQSRAGLSEWIVISELQCEKNSPQGKSHKLLGTDSWGSRNSPFSGIIFKQPDESTIAMVCMLRRCK